MRSRTAQLEMLPQQIEFVACDAKLAAARGGIGSGKTTCAVVWAWKRMMAYPKAAHYACGADFEQLRLGFYQSFQNFLEVSLRWRAGIDFQIVTTPRPELRFLKTGATMSSLSAELGERIRSLEFQTLIMEEPQTWHGGLQVYQTLIGRLRHTTASSKLYPDLQPQARVTFNPCAVGEWLYDLIEVRWREHGYPSWRFSLRDNYLLPDHEEYIKLHESNLPRALWPVEIDGHYRTVGGGVYRAFDSNIHCVDPVGLPAIALDPVKPLWWSLDFNVGFQCSLVGQTHVQQPRIEYDGQMVPRKIYTQSAFQERVIYVLDEITLSDAGPSDVVEEFLKRYGPQAIRQGLFLYGDPAGGARTQMMSSHSAIRSNWEAIITGLERYGITRRSGLLTIRVPNQHPAIQDRVAMVNEQLRAAQGGFGMLINPQRCPELITDLRTMAYKPGTNEVDKPTVADGKSELSKRSHLSEALGYMVTVERRLAQRVPQDFKLFR